MQTDMSQNPQGAAAQAGDSTEQDQNIASTAPGQLRVIKRNGKVVSYDDDKITVAISKAFLAVEGGTAAASSRIHDVVARRPSKSVPPSNAVCPPAARSILKRFRTR